MNIWVQEIQMGSGEGSSLMNFIVCTIHLIVRMINSRRLRWVGHVGNMAKGKNASKMSTGKPIGNRSLGQGVDGRTILEWILKR